MAKKVKRPLTQKEIRAKNEAARNKSKETLTIINISKQLVPLQIKKAKGMDFYVSARDVHLHPGKKITLPKHRLWTEQIDRLSKRRLIRVLIDSEKVEETKRKMAAKREQTKPEANLPSKKVKKAKKAKKKTAKSPSETAPEE